MVGVSETDKVTAGWVATLVRRRVPAWAKEAYQTREDWEQDVWVYVLKALRDYRRPQIPFAKWAGLCVELRLKRRVNRAAYRHASRWVQMPELPGEDGTAEPLSAHLPDRPPAPRPALAVWCEDGFARLRSRSLTWRQRVVLYLRLVEGWTQDEVASAWGVTRGAEENQERRAREAIRRRGVCRGVA